MKLKLFSALAIASLGIIACQSNEDDTSVVESNTEFFNLKVGNEWVYKTYDRTDYTSDFKFNGTIDSLKVESMVTVNNLTYSKIRLKTNHTTGNPTIGYIYRRVNSKGYLVSISSYYINNNMTSQVTEANENVLHPGNDSAYKSTEPFLPYGVISSKVEAEKMQQVEGHSFSVKPYNATLVPSAEYSNLNNLDKKITENEYALGVGKVRSYCHAIESSYNFEERLTSYKLN